MRGVFLFVFILGQALASEQRVIDEYHDAMRGDAEAQVKVAKYYENMYEKTKIGSNLSEAQDWFNKAAKQKNVEGMWGLAKLSQRPEVEVHNVSTAFHWYQQLYENNQPGTGCNYQLGVMYVTGGYAEPPGKQEYFKAYYHLLLQRASGIELDIGHNYESLAKSKLSAAQIKDAQDQAFRWVEDHNKPRLKTSEQIAGGSKNSSNGQNKKDDNDNSPTAKEQAVDTSDKALALALKNAQENARAVTPLGKTKKYTLPNTDRDQGNK